MTKKKKKEMKTSKFLEDHNSVFSISLSEFLSKDQSAIAGKKK